MINEIASYPCTHVSRLRSLSFHRPETQLSVPNEIHGAQLDNPNVENWAVAVVARREEPPILANAEHLPPHAALGNTV